MTDLFLIQCLFNWKALSFVRDPTVNRNDLKHWIVGERYIEIILIFFITSRFF